jgi:hypothetical protein
VGGENACIDTKDGFKASDCGRLGRQAAGHPWRARRMVKSCRNDCPTAEVLLEAKAAAPHPEPYQTGCQGLFSLDRIGHHNVWSLKNG